MGNGVTNNGLGEPSLQYIVKVHEVEFYHHCCTLRTRCFFISKSLFTRLKPEESLSGLSLICFGCISVTDIFKDDCLHYDFNSKHVAISSVYKQFSID